MPTLIAALIIVFLAVAFSLQNDQTVSIMFFQWDFQGSLVLVLLATLCLGMLIHLLASIPERIRKSRQTAQLQKRINKLEHSLSEKMQSSKHWLKAQARLTITYGRIRFYFTRILLNHGRQHQKFFQSENYHPLETPREKRQHWAHFNHKWSATFASSSKNF